MIPVSYQNIINCDDVTSTSWQLNAETGQSLFTVNTSNCVSPTYDWWGTGTSQSGFKQLLCDSTSTASEVFGNWYLDTESYGTTIDHRGNAYIKATYEFLADEGSWNPAASRRQRLRRLIRERAAPAVIVRGRPITQPADQRELRARETLQRVVGRVEYRRYLTHGFVVAKNRRSGRTYQIFPGSKFTKVWVNGKHVETLCVVLQGNFPPTDSTIVRFLMVLNNEDQFRSLAINQSVYNSRPSVRTVARVTPLTELAVA